MAGGGAALGEVLLVVFLGAEEIGSGFYFGDDGALEDVEFFEDSDGREARRLREQARRLAHVPQQRVHHSPRFKLIVDS